MAHSLSAKKRIRQNARHRARNRFRKRQVHLAVRAFDESLRDGGEAQSVEALREAIKRIDKVSCKGTIHRNTAARRKSQLQRRLNAALGKPA